MCVSAASIRSGSPVRCVEVETAARRRCRRPAAAHTEARNSRRPAEDATLSSTVPPTASPTSRRCRCRASCRPPAAKCQYADPRKYCLSVSLSLSLSFRSHIAETTRPNCANFLRVLTVAVARSSSDGSIIFCLYFRFYG